MKRLKRWSSILVLASLVFTLTACGGSASSSKPAETKAPETETAVEAETEEAAVEAETETEAEAETDQGTTVVASRGDWTREGYFAAENGYLMSITWMDDVADGPGWFIAAQLGEDWEKNSYGGFLSAEGDTLKGTLPAGDGDGEVTLTISEDGEEGISVAIEDGETYPFAPVDLSELIEEYTDTADDFAEMESEE